MGGGRPVGAKRVAVPYVDTVLIMPTNMRTAAVELWVGRGNGPLLAIGAKIARQLEDCYKKQLPLVTVSTQRR